MNTTTTMTCPRCKGLILPEDIFCVACAVVEAHRTRFSKPRRSKMTWARWDLAFTGIVAAVALALVVALAWMMHS